MFSSEFYDFGWGLFFPKGQNHLLVPSQEVTKCCFHMQISKLLTSESW